MDQRIIDVARIATAIDTDGSISISVMQRGNMGYQFNTSLNVRQTERGVGLLNLAKNTFGGSVRSTHSKMFTWQINKHSLLREILTEALPYFIIKRKEADLMLEALDLLDFSPRARFEHQIGRGSFSDNIKLRVLEIANSMNIGQQKETSRRNKEFRNQILIQQAELKYE